MTFHTHSQIHPGSYPYRDPPPNMPRKHAGWIAAVLLGTVVLVVIAFVIGFRRAALDPVPAIGVPAFEPPPPPALPPTQTPEPE